MKNKFKPQRFRIFQNDNDIIISIEKSNLTIDTQELLPIINNHTKQDKQSLDEYNIFVAFYGIILTGFKEMESNPLFFGELDKEGVLIESKPIYYLQGGENIDSVIARNEMTKQSEKKDFKAPNNSNTDSSASLQNDKNQLNNNSTHIGTSTLQVFLNNSTLTIHNYSLLDSSLNIKLKSTSKESREILEKEQTQREQIQRDSNSIDSLTSTAFLHPILEDNELKCPHNGVVKLKSNKGKNFKSNNIPMILESDLINSSIVGCTNNIAGVPTPCTLVSLILPTSMGYKKYALTIKNRICKIKVW